MRALSAGIESLADTTSARLPGLDLLRAFAVLLTILMHFAWLYAATFLGHDLEHVSLRAATSTEQAWVFAQYYGLYGVYLFFMISGYLIARQWLRPASVPLAAYLRDRGRRIFPAFWAALAGVYGLSLLRGLPPPHRYGDVLANATLVNWFDPPASPPWLIVSWSLQVEWLFYLAMPLLAWLLRGRTTQWQRAVLWIVAIGLAVALKSLGERHFAYPVFFALGIAVCIDAKLVHLWAKKLRVLPLLIVLFALQLAYAVAAPVGEPKAPWHFGHFDAFALCFAVAGGLTFVAVSFAPPSWMLRRPLLWLGRISYSVYLWHLTVLIAVFEVVAKTEIKSQMLAWPWGVRWALLLAIGAGLTLLVSAISYRLFEAPYFSSRRQATASHTG
jgi:peptidoglycan/LPS O-acetylase OafA/YrhL